MINRIETAILTAGAALLCISVLPRSAAALTLEKMVEYYLGTRTDAALAPNQKLIDNSFDKRASQLSRQIVAYQNSGKLPAGDAERLKFEINRLQSQYRRYQESDGGYTYGETNLIVQDFRELSDRIQTILRLAATPASYRDVNARQAKLRNKVEEGVLDRTLTRAEADSLRYSLRWTDALKAKLINQDGFTNADHDVLEAALDRIDRRLTRWINNDIASEDDPRL